MDRRFAPILPAPRLPQYNDDDNDRTANLDSAPHPQSRSIPKRLNLFWALSRTPHGLIDMTTPCLAALLWLGTYPPWATIVVGLVTVFAGYTAVYALNDIVGYRSDRAKLDAGGFRGNVHRDDLDALLVRHPMAQGFLALHQGIVWASVWGLVAAMGAYWLNPVCLVIFAAGCLLETLYCVLWRISPYRALVSGTVKSTGAIAAVFAVDPRPSMLFLLFLFLVIFLWEIGGQNAPNDWTDIEEDRQFGARTIPVILGLDKTRDIVLGALFLAIVANLILFLLSPACFGPLMLTATVVAGVALLLWPAWQLHGSARKADAMRLFNLASYYPLVLFVIVALRLLV